VQATRRIRLLTILILTASVLAFATGCGGAKRPWSGEESVLTFRDAVWVQVGDEIVLVRATWKAEKGLTIEDVRYLFRGGIVLTPGFGGKVLETFAKETP